VTMIGPSSITVASPALRAGTTCFVTVTTPTGTSSDYYPIFTYI
jgi:hypothetical protein